MAAGTEVAGNTMPPRRARGWFMTLNNPTAEEEALFAAEDTVYTIYQIESGENKTEHIQGLLYYANPRVWPKARFPRAHFSPVRCLKDAIAYCSKEETRVRGPYEKGERPAQGERSDLKEIAARVVGGTPLSDIAVTYPDAFVRYHKGLAALKESVTPERKDKPSVIWLWGPPGSGKTRWCHDRHASIYIKDGTQWWNGYEGQEAIVIDDFDGKWPFRDLLRLLDRYAYQGQTKGGYVKISSPFIYITCDRHWREIAWPGEGRNLLGQLERRLTGKKEFFAADVPVDVPDI